MLKACTPCTSPSISRLLSDSLQRSVSALSDAQHTTAATLSDQKVSMTTAHEAELSQCKEMLRIQHLQDLEQLQLELSLRHQVRTLRFDDHIEYFAHLSALKCMVPLWFVTFCPVLSCPVLSCPVLSCPVLSCPVLSCPVLFCSI